MLRRLATTLFAVALTTAAATAQEPPPRVVPYPIDPSPNFLAAVANGTRTLTGVPGPNHWTSYAHYELAAELDPVQKRVTGKARLTWHNRSPAPVNRLVVHCYQDLMKANAMRTRVVVPTPGFELGRVAIDGEAVRATPRDTLLNLRLPNAVAPGGKTTVEIDWAYEVPKAGTAPRTGWEGEDVFYLAYWYPQFAVYDDVDGWVADPYRGNGEFYMGYADYDIAFTVPSGYLVRATGVLQNPTEVLTPKALAALDKARETREIQKVIDADDLQNGTALVAGANGKSTWRFHAENVRDAAVSIARTYLWDATHAVVKDKHGPGQDGICEIHAVYERNSGDWVRGAEYTRHTIEYMSRMVFPYPWPHMTACEGIIGGGMEFPMMTIVGGTRPAGTIAHEVVHMWFPMVVGSNEKRYAWQDEGFTSFWTTLCRDDFQGRQNGPRADILSVANTIARGGDEVLMRHGDTYGTDNFGFASYSKTAAVLHQTRAMLGDEPFFAAFRRYTADWAYKHPQPLDFFRSFAASVGQDLEPYFRTWFYEEWSLDHAVGKVEANGAGTLVTVLDRGRAWHPCVVEVAYADGRTERQLVPMLHWRTTTSAELRFGADVVKVTLDPDLGTIDVDRKNNVWEK